MVLDVRPVQASTTTDPRCVVNAFHVPAIAVWDRLSRIPGRQFSAPLSMPDAVRMYVGDGK